MNAYIIKGYRTAVGKAFKGGFRFTRPDILASVVIKKILSEFPQINAEIIDDLIVGNAMPEAEQGLNMGRLISLLAFDSVKVPGITINRYCSSGLESIALASYKIHSGQADCIIAGGVESMSLIPMGGWKIAPNVDIANSHPDYYWGMGLTAEAVANEFKISRDDQDQFALNSHKKALDAINQGKFTNEIVPVDLTETFINNKIKSTRLINITTDEGPRADTTLELLSKLKPVFALKGSVTAGNSSQTSDGAAFVLIVSEQFLKMHNLKPIARLCSYSVAGVPPRIMGMGPVEAIPKALKLANVSLNQIDLIELNEAFASQSLAVIRELDLDTSKVNVNGGAIALGHPLGCSGAKLSIQLINELQRNKNRYGVVSMCVGTGQGAAGVFELL